MNARIFYTKPSITELEIGYATDAVRNGWGEKCYEYITKFESGFKNFTGATHAIATSSCTGALHMGLAALGVGSGDEVIIADTNWIASAAPITYLGAKPVFVDILHDTWCIDPSLVESAITARTKAIIAVHLYGNVCQLDKLLEIGSRMGIPVIEDAAEAIGSRWQGKHVGTLGRFGVFSFHGTKTMTTGEGGMFVTNDDVLYEKVLTLSSHGRARGQTKQFWSDELGFKYKMANVQAAIGCGQIERAEELVARKREIFLDYHRELSDVTCITMNPESPGTTNGYWMPTAVFNAASGIKRETLQAVLNAQNIDARVFFHPLSSLPMFEDKEENINAWAIPTRAINLPSYHDMTHDQIKKVATILRVLAEGAAPK